jgi:hypothetical protein
MICALFIIFLVIFAGCTSSSDQKSSTDQTLSRSELNSDIDLATKIVPNKIPGFDILSKGRDPMSGTMYGDEYTEHGYYEPSKGSKYYGLIDSLLVDVIVYSDEEKAQDWYTKVWEKLSDSPIQVNTKNGIYRYRMGEATIAMIDNNLIIISASLYNMQPPDNYHEVGITKEAAFAGALEAVTNLNLYD